MKYLKNFKIFESTFTDSDVFNIKELFYDLSDNGFVVDVGRCESSVLDFSKSNVIDIDVDSIHDFILNDEEIINVDIRSKDCNLFLVSDIEDVLNFSIGYAKDALGYDVSYIYINSLKLYKYYKSFEYLPMSTSLREIQIAFTK